MDRLGLWSEVPGRFCSALKRALQDLPACQGSLGRRRLGTLGVGTWRQVNLNPQDAMPDLGASTKLSIA